MTVSVPSDLQPVEPAFGYHFADGSSVTVPGVDPAIVVDDASTDNSDEEVRNCLSRLDDSRFDYVRLDTNVGQTGAIKRGLSELDTPFVGFLDSDDKWYENFLERHLCVHMNAEFPVALTYCDSHIIDADDIARLTAPE